MDHERLLIEALRPLCEPLYDSLTSSAARVRSQLPELDDSDVRPALAHAIRALAYLNLRTQGLGHWSVFRQNNAGVVLSADSHHVRLLHQSPGGAAPPPGRNLARRRYYSNPTLDAYALPPLNQLLGLWTVDTAGAVTIRIVRPIGTWGFGRREKIDLDFVLPSSSMDLDELRFEVTADEDDFDIAVPHEEDGNDGEFGLGS